MRQGFTILFQTVTPTTRFVPSQAFLNHYFFFFFFFLQGNTPRQLQNDWFLSMDFGMTLSDVCRRGWHLVVFERLHAPLLGGPSREGARHAASLQQQPQPKLKRRSDLQVTNCTTAFSWKHPSLQFERGSLEAAVCDFYTKYFFSHIFLETMMWECGIRQIIYI